jgi:hypothetical protein
MTVEPLLADSQAKLRAALALVFASEAGYAPIALNRVYSHRNGSRTTPSATDSSGLSSRA